METLRRSIKNYGLYYKLAVFIFAVAWTGIIQDLYHSSDKRQPSIYYTQGYQSSMEASAGRGKNIDQDKLTRQNLIGEAEQLIVKAKDQGKNYTLDRYFVDFDKLMDLEDKFHMHLDGFDRYRILNPLLVLIVREPGNARSDYVNSVERRVNAREGIFEHQAKPGENRKFWLGALLWLLVVYLKLMLMATTFYLIRFIEKGERVMAVFAAAPLMMASRIIFWPNWWMSFPNWDDSAELYRYLRLKTHYLRTKPFGYFVTVTEDNWLKEQAKREGEAFEESLKQLLNLQIDLGLPRKTIAIAVCSLVIGTFIQPVMARGSNLSDNAKAVHSSLEKIQVDHLFVNGVSPPGHDHLDYGSQPVLMSSREITIGQSFFVLFVETVERYIQPPNLTIEHIPLSRSV